MHVSYRQYMAFGVREVVGARDFKAPCALIKGSISRKLDQYVA